MTLFVLDENKVTFTIRVPF